MEPLWQYFHGTVIMAGWEVSKRGPTFYMTLISSALTGWQGLFTAFRSFSSFHCFFCFFCVCVYVCENLVGGELKVSVLDSRHKVETVIFVSPAVQRFGSFSKTGKFPHFYSINNMKCNTTHRPAYTVYFSILHPKQENMFAIVFVTNSHA